jgi:hypothetical protein
VEWKSAIAPARKLPAQTRDIPLMKGLAIVFS